MFDNNEIANCWEKYSLNQLKTEMKNFFSEFGGVPWDPLFKRFRKIIFNYLSYSRYDETLVNYIMDKLDSYVDYPKGEGKDKYYNFDYDGLTYRQIDEDHIDLNSVTCINFWYEIDKFDGTYTLVYHESEDDQKDQDKILEVIEFLNNNSNGEAFSILIYYVINKNQKIPCLDVYGNRYFECSPCITVSSIRLKLDNNITCGEYIGKNKWYDISLNTLI